MKSLVPWFLAVALLGGIYFLFSAGKEKDAQIAKLKQDNQEVESLRLENAELKKIPVQAEELERLRREHDELLRLRSEVQKDRTEIKQLTAQLSTAQAQTIQAQQQVERAGQLASENQALRTQQAQQTADLKNAQAQTVVCIQFLRQIDGAKQQWALENKKTPNDVPTPEDIAPYLPNPEQIRCPAGGVYTINAVGVMPACSVPSHVLTK